MSPEAREGGIKIAPGLLPVVFPIGLLGSVSPSSFQTLKQCKLSAVWTANRMPRLLPKHPAARLGTVMHSMLEKAGNGELRSIASFDTFWLESVEEEERKMRESWIEQHLLPLESTAKHFELKKRQCKLLAQRICLDSAPILQKCLPPRTAGQEVELRTPDGQVKGRADVIKRQEEGDIIIDFKTGDLTTDRDSNTPQVIENYALQLKLYAAIYHAERGSWPVALRLVGIEGQSIDVPFSPTDCLKLLQEARTILNKTNCEIRSSSDYSATLTQFASPGEENCKYCGYRPCCTPYWGARAKGGDGWPNDVKGSLEQYTVLGNGRLFIKVVSSYGDESVIIRGLDPNRHPALNGGSGKLLLFGLVRDGSTTSFKEGVLTTIYTIR